MKHMLTSSTLQNARNLATVKGIYILGIRFKPKRKKKAKKAKRQPSKVNVKFGKKFIKVPSHSFILRWGFHCLLDPILIAWYTGKWRVQSKAFLKKTPGQSTRQVRKKRWPVRDLDGNHWKVREWVWSSGHSPLIEDLWSGAKVSSKGTGPWWC